MSEAQNKIYVSNIPSSITSKELKFIFDFFCVIEEASVKVEKATPSNTGFVVLRHPCQIPHVLINLQKMEVDGRRIKLSLTEEVAELPPKAKKIKIDIPMPTLSSCEIK